MKNVIIRFKPYGITSYSPKFLFGTPDNTALDCYNWSSNSGLHFSKCWNYETKKTVNGWVRILYHVGKFSPMTYKDAKKPTPPEPKNIIGWGFDKVWQDFIERTMELLPDNKNILIHEDEEGVNIYVYQDHDYLVSVKYVGRQSNLEVYFTVILNRLYYKLERFGQEYNRGIAIEGHFVTYDNKVRAVSTEKTRRTYREKAVLMFNIPEKLTIIHPEHKKVELDLTPYDKFPFYKFGIPALLLIHRQVFERDYTLE